MLTQLHSRKSVQLLIGLLAGIVFGFLLHKGRVTKYDVIIGQLLLEDFTVAKVILTAVVTGMIGVHVLVSLGMARLHSRSGSVGSTVVGGLIFGVGFAMLGYCPGTLAGAVGNGCLDALLGGVTGILVGTGLFAAFYPRLDASILNKGKLGGPSLPRLFKVNPWAVVPPAAALFIGLLVWMEKTWPSP